MKICLVISRFVICRQTDWQTNMAKLIQALSQGFTAYSSRRIITVVLA
jgi:hypothetical protein